MQQVARLMLMGAPCGDCVRGFLYQSFCQLSLSMRSFVSSLALCALSFAFLVAGYPLRTAYAAETKVAVLDRPFTDDGRNNHYLTNREPLVPSVLVKLPVGSIAPQGWLLETLKRQRAGITGRLPEISAWLQQEDNAWLSTDGRGKWGWEEVPYWLRGYIVLAQLLRDEEMLETAKVWIEAVINGQRKDGNFGPLRVFGDDDSQDLWANMVMLHCLQTYYEYSEDQRVLDLMSKYFRYQSTIPDDKFLTHHWQFYRGGDNLQSIYWLYNHTGEEWLLDLAQQNHANTADWKMNDDLPSLHCVNIAQAFSEPGIYYQQSRAADDLEAVYRNIRLIQNRFGQMPGGMFAADEHARPGYSDPRQATETCGIVEQMRSDENLLSITGDIFWADHCEDVAFNTLPAAYTPDYRALRYLTAPNLVRSDAEDHSPGVNNLGPMFAFNPLSHRCCQHNQAQGWPRFAEHLWMATPDNGICATLYGPCQVTAKVAEGTEVKITEATLYPFAESVELVIELPKPTAFPLYLRIPGWCSESTITVAGEPVAQNVDPGSYVRISRQWRSGDKVVVELPMNVKLRRWERNHNSVSIERGPLAYSLKIGEEQVRRDPIETAKQDSQWQEDVDVEQWPAVEVLPTTPWNFGLALKDDDKLDAVVHERDWPADDYPFTASAVPISLQVTGRQIPQWQLDLTGLCGALRDSPVYAGTPEQTLTLVPMGAALLRISAFPEVKGDRNLPRWHAAVPLKYRATASWTAEGSKPTAMVDGIEPQVSSDRSIPSQSFAPHLGTREWVQADFDEPQRVSEVGVYWCDDRDNFDEVPAEAADYLFPGRTLRLPKTWKLLYLVDGEWQEVVTSGGFPTKANVYNTVQFEEIETTALRIELELRPKRSGGILEWKIFPSPVRSAATAGL